MSFKKEYLAHKENLNVYVYLIHISFARLYIIRIKSCIWLIFIILVEILPRTSTRYLNTRAERKNSILFATFSSIFGDKMNLSRIKFFGLFICALCKVQTVWFEKPATAFDTDVRVDSSLRRIQRFISRYVLNSKLIVRFVFCLLPHKTPYRLTMDRTNRFW